MKCPNCGGDCEQDMVDVGVGSIPSGPMGCPDCHWVEGDPVIDMDERDTLIDDPRMPHGSLIDKKF